MEDQLKNTAQRRAVQLLSKDIQYIPIQNNINNNNDNNSNTSNGRNNNNNKTTTLLHQKLTALQKHYENKLRHVDNKIDAVARTTSYDISTAIELLVQLCRQRELSVSIDISSFVFQFCSVVSSTGLTRLAFRTKSSLRQRCLHIRPFFHESPFCV